MSADLSLEFQLLGPDLEHIKTQAPHFYKTLTDYVVPELDRRLYRPLLDSKSNLAQHRKQYRFWYTLYSDVVGALRQAADSDVVQMARDAILLEEVKELCQMRTRDGSVEKRGLLGLSDADLEQCVTPLDTSLLDSLHQFLNEELNAIWTQRLGLIVRTATGQDQTDFRKVVIQLEQQARQVDEARRDDVQRRVKILHEIRAYHQDLEEVVDMLWQLIMDFKLTFEVEKSSAFTKYFGSIIENILLKMQTMKLEFLVSMYPRETSEQLHQLRQQMKLRMKQLDDETASLDAELAQYHAGGPEFHQIVKTYTEISSEIEATYRDIARLE